jgi:hypothetical protein
MTLKFTTLDARVVVTKNCETKGIWNLSFCPSRWNARFAQISVGMDR